MARSRTWFTQMAALGLAASLALAAPARAGGDDIDATVDAEDSGPSYFGFVRDQRGSAVADAKVVLRPKSGDGVEVKSNTIGMYRTHVSKTAEPSEVEVSCVKDGYRQARVNRRSTPTPGARVIETDCTLQRL